MQETHKVPPFYSSRPRDVLQNSTIFLTSSRYRSEREKETKEKYYLSLFLLDIIHEVIITLVEMMQSDIAILPATGISSP